jgi:hypothetical protein
MPAIAVTALEMLEHMREHRIIFSWFEKVAAEQLFDVNGDAVATIEKLIQFKQAAA